MPSTYTGSGIELIGDGEQSGSWGDTTNTNLQIIDRLTSQVGTISLAGTTHTLSLSDGTLSDGQYAVLVFAGSPSGTNTVTINPNDAQRVFIVRNTSGESVIITQGSGGNVTVPDGESAILFCDGAGSGAAVTSVSDDFVSGTLAAIGALTPTDGNFIVGNGTTWVAESGNTVLASIGVTSTTTELNALDGFTGDVNDLNYAKDLRATGVTTSEYNVLDGITASTSELNILDGVTATASEINLLDGVTWTLSNYNTLTASAAELNVLDGVIISTTELNYLDNASGNIQSQIDAIVAAGGANNNTITLSAGTGLTGGGSFTLNQAVNETITFTGVTTSQGDWEAGTGTTESLVTPAKVKAAIDSFATIGSGQTYQVLTGSRSAATNYTNSTGKPILVSVQGFGPAGYGNVAYLRLLVDGKEWDRAQITDSTNSGDLAKYGTVTAVVPDGETYRAEILTAGSITLWTELR